MVLTMNDISIVEVPAQQVLGMKKTGTYLLIPELLMKIYEFTVGKKIQISESPHLSLSRDYSGSSDGGKREGNRHGRGRVAGFRDRGGYTGD
jgi:hypothetical protein